MDSTTCIAIPHETHDMQSSELTIMRRDAPTTNSTYGSLAKPRSRVLPRDLSASFVAERGRLREVARDADPIERLSRDEAGQEFRSRADAGRHVNRPHVVVNGVGTDFEPGGDLFFGEPVQEQV